MIYNKKNLEQVDVQNKTVIVRLDLNVPMKSGEITDCERIEAALPTLKYLIERNCKIVCLSHLGRIKSLDDIKSNKKSLQPVALKLQEYLNGITKVNFLNKCVGNEVIEAVNKLNFKEILLLENTRYNDVNEQGEVVKKESKNDEQLGKFWASLGDVFVNDAFGTSHRTHASNVGIAKNIQTSCIGLLIKNELNHLQKLTNNPKHPFVVVLGGAKVLDKLGVIKQLLKLADAILIGGGMATTFLKAKGIDCGKSIYEQELLDTAKEMLNGEYANKIILPVDLTGGVEFANNVPIKWNITDPLPSSNFMLLDIGDKTIEIFKRYLLNAQTIFWNGPVGVFEFSNFAIGTKQIAEIICESTKNGSYSVIGGGDSAAAVNQLGIASGFSFISTGGGASLTFVEDSDLPGISCISEANKII